MARSTKFWRKNEKEVMEDLGLRATVNSGAGFLEKEDGQNEYIICQLKSTESKQLTIKKRDIDVLELNAQTVHKTPLFAIQFLSAEKGKDKSDVFIMMRPEDAMDIANNLIYQQPIERPLELKLEDEDDALIYNNNNNNNNIIKGSKRKRDKFFEQKENNYRKEKKAK